MAAENLIGNMFGVDPNQLAQQRYDAQRQAALQYAQLDPFARANMAMYQAGGDIVNAGAGMMGIKAPGQAEAESRQSIMSSIDTSTPDGLLKGAQIALQQGNPRLASELNRAAQVLAEEKAKIDYTKAQTRKIDEAPLKLEWLPHPTDPSLEIKAMWSPELQDYVPLEGARASTRRAGGVGATKPNIVTDAAGNITVLSPSGTKIVAKYEGMGKPTSTYEKEALKTPIMQQAAGSIDEALDYVKKGIYTGGYAEAKKAAAKYNPLADKEKVVNTESFISTIGNVVIPRLQEFGGNDSNEEMKYLQRVSAGDITLEESAIKKVLNSAKKKMEAEIERRNAGKPPTYPGGYNPQLQERKVIKFGDLP